MTDAKFPKYLKRLLQGKKTAGSNAAAGEPEEEVLRPCCQGKVTFSFS